MRAQQGYLLRHDNVFAARYLVTVMHHQYLQTISQVRRDI